MEKKKYLSSVTLIRGIAALAVCLFHFTKGFISNVGSISEILMPYAWVGVEVFFVISGFVIPYMLLGQPFKGKHYGGYLLKRLIRIEPAYLGSIILIIGLNYISSLFTIYKGPPFSVSGHNILLHLGYLVEFFDGTWMNPVYWTLAIEFQYYLVIGFLLILWNRNNKYLTIITLLAFFALSFIPQDTVRLFNYTDIFTIGIVGAFFKKDYISKKYFFMLVAMIGVVIYFHHTYVITILAVGAILGIAFLNTIRNLNWLIFFGHISYSLYLLHVPIGGRVINLMSRFALGASGKVLVVIAAIVASVIAAYLFYLLVEKPSHRLSRKIKLKLD